MGLSGRWWQHLPSPFSLEPPLVRVLVAAALLLAPTLALADVDPRFAKLRDQAKPLGALGTFLDNYIGECGGVMGDADCKQNAAAFRKAANKQRFYMIIGEEQANMLAPGPYDPGAGEYTVNIAPMFAAGGYAVTHGTPKKTDANGNPMVMYVQSKGKMPPGWSAPNFQRLFQTRALRVQVVFSPQGTWTLPKKGGGKQHGVKAKIDAILVTIGRTGEPVALWLADRR